MDIRKLNILRWKTHCFHSALCCGGNAQLLRALRYIAEYEGRSANREIEVLIKRYVAEFEKKNADEEIAGQMWKTTTKTNGTSIKLKLGNGESITIQ